MSVCDRSHIVHQNGFSPRLRTETARSISHIQMTI